MGARERALGAILGADPARRLPRPRREDFLDAGLGPELGPQIEAVHRRLGGLGDRFPANLRGRWDIALDGIAVELDEELHFNRYRGLTLESPLHDRLTGFPRAAYRGFCMAHETECLRAGRHGGRWTGPSAERQFGPSPPRGAFDAPGPARWRQRAFYDFLKDLAPLAVGLPVARLAIWDVLRIGGAEVALGAALRSPGPEEAAAIRLLLEERAGGA